MGDEMNVSLGAELELERRLGRYAEVRLSPSAAAVARMRARVMREARLGFAEAADARNIASASAAMAGGRRGGLRRAGGLLAAASLTLAVAAGAMAASQAGGPLYGPRIALEELTLPSDPLARAEAEVDRLEARLDEVLVAAKSGDHGAIAAALQAYQSIAEEALAGAGFDAGVLEALRVALDRHVAVLEAVAAKVPEQARAAIERNIDRASDRSEIVLDRIDAMAPRPGTGPVSPAAPPTGERPPRPEGSPTPNQTAKPEKTPRPTPDPPTTVAPAPTAEPVAEPAPQPTPKRVPPSERPGRTPPADGDRSGHGAP